METEETLSLAKWMSSQQIILWKTLLILLNKFVYNRINLACPLLSFQVMAQVSQSKFKSWIFHRALSSKEADLKKFVSSISCLLPGGTLIQKELGCSSEIFEKKNGTKILFCGRGLEYFFSPLRGTNYEITHIMSCGIYLAQYRSSDPRLPHWL